VLLTVAVARGPALAADPPAAPPAAPPVDAEVQRHAILGQRLLERGQTQEAIAEFRNAYELRADARFLYEIGDGYRRLGLRDQALFYFDHYLSAAPDAPDREDVEEQIAALRAAPAPRGAHDVVAPVVAPVPVVAPEAERPAWRRWWSWAALGVVIAGGVATAIVLGRDQTKVPATALGDQKFY
jgi:tetratricopeptide (TPR) repeat protein